MTERNDTPDSLPKEADFDPSGGFVDAQCAWKNFGGLSLADASKKFREQPEYYQEDFMFMGGVAFSYYFSVIERYIYESQADADNGFEVAAMRILAHCIKEQFGDSSEHLIRSIRPRILDLVVHVRANLSQYCEEPDGQPRIDSAWAELQSRIVTATHAG